MGKNQTGKVKIPFYTGGQGRPPAKVRLDMGAGVMCAGICSERMPWTQNGKGKGLG